MARISVDQNFIIDLIDFKLRYLKSEIEQILKKWNYHSSSAFLEDAKNGILLEAEEDAIVLKNLKDQIIDLTQRKLDWKN